MRIAFLGTGSAFSLERYNGAVVVDGRLLLDGGAPLLPHMHRAGIDPGAIEALLLTHFHGDHVLGLPPFVLYRAFNPAGPLVVVGPPGVESRLEALFALSWGEDWPVYRDRAGLVYHEAATSGEVAGVRYETVRLDHGHMDCRGYRLHLGGRILAYAGDTIASPPLDELVREADVAITEATSPDPSAVHTSWDEAQALAARHPGTRFLFNHIFSGSTPGAAHDLDVIDV
ncbi:MAG TPA: ribonuclease Z [Candidatus Dormibacteraeota bacterium]|jgi:ribonuclease BN (tRNA processing enzyme)